MFLYKSRPYVSYGKIIRVLQPWIPVASVKYLPLRSKSAAENLERYSYCITIKIEIIKSIMHVIWKTVKFDNC